jgi:hypothetical protein
MGSSTEKTGRYRVPFAVNGDGTTFWQPTVAATPAFPILAGVIGSAYVAMAANVVTITKTEPAYRSSG